VFKVHEIWQQPTVPTAPLNRWLAASTQAHPPPLSDPQARIKLRYI